MVGNFSLEPYCPQLFKISLNTKIYLFSKFLTDCRLSEGYEPYVLDWSAELFVHSQSLESHVSHVKRMLFSQLEYLFSNDSGMCDGKGVTTKSMQK